MAQDELEFEILLAVEAAEVTSENLKKNIAVLNDLQVVPVDQLTIEQRSRVVEIIKYHFS